jgi:hypothetical protein
LFLGKFFLCNSTVDLSWFVDRSIIWDTQEEAKTIPPIISVSDVNVNTNIHQSTTSLPVINSNTAMISPSATITPTASLAIIPQVQQNQQLQSQLSLSLPNLLISSSNNLFLSIKIMTMMNSNASTTLASIVTQNTTNNNTLSILTSLTSNELHAS